VMTGTLLALFSTRSLLRTSSSAAGRWENGRLGWCLLQAVMAGSGLVQALTYRCWNMCFLCDPLLLCAFALQKDRRILSRLITAYWWSSAYVEVALHDCMHNDVDDSSGATRARAMTHPFL